MLMNHKMPMRPSLLALTLGIAGGTAIYFCLSWLFNSKLTLWSFLIVPLGPLAVTAVIARRFKKARLKRKVRPSGKLRRVICAAFRHSVITENCMGYQHCGRCGELLGDTLAGAYAVECGLQCGCEKCQETYARLGFVDMWLVPRPEWLGWKPVEWKEHCRNERDRFMAEIRAENKRMKEQLSTQ